MCAGSKQPRRRLSFVLQHPIVARQRVRFPLQREPLRLGKTEDLIAEIALFFTQIASPQDIQFCLLGCRQEAGGDWKLSR